ncbi:hypothetical protein HYV88_05270 [Candidatus Woesearchaeota archaeon]|nr:hypothetical protein [Candidatus Woesearchaeota archaeon]
MVLVIFLVGCTKQETVESSEATGLEDDLNTLNETDTNLDDLNNLDSELDDIQDLDI